VSARPALFSGASGVGLAVILTFTTVAVFVSAWFPWRERQYAEAALEHKARNQAELVSYTIAPALDFNDVTMINEVFRGAARDVDFVGVRAVAEDGRVVAEHGRPDESLGIAVEVPISTESGSAGKLTLVMSRERVDAENAAQLRVALGIGVTIFVLGLFVGVGVARAIRRIATLTDENVRASAAADQERMKARFLANMSHEIRTPLNGVIGLADVLSRRSLEPQSAALVKSILRSGRNLLGLINDVLDLSRLESGRLEIERAPFDPEQSAVTVCETLMATARQRGLELVLDVAGDLPASIEGDRLRVEQVLTNLTGNALKFTARGHVVVRLRWSADGGGVLHASVEDTGIGIPEDKLETVFQPFSQADASTTRRFGGTGLGLTISRDQVRLMGGDLRVESTPEKGSTFSFDVRAPMLAPAVRPALANAPSHLLAVTDQEAVGEAIGAACELHGIASAVVAPGEASARIAELAKSSAHALTVVVWDAAVTVPDDAREALAAATSGGRTHVLVHASAVETEAVFPDANLLPKPLSRAAFAAALDGAGDPSFRPERAIEENADGPRVLVAEDDETNRLVIASFLVELGLRAEHVLTGAAAVEAAASRGPYAVVLMDCQMPEMDGYEACRRIREAEKARGAARVPIVAVTAHATDDDRGRADAAGMDGYLTKPLTLDTFTAVVLPLLPGGAQPAPAPRLALAFRRSVDQGIGTIAGALSRNDMRAVASEAHRLAGSCLAVGENDAAALARELEKLAREEARDACGERIFALELALAEAAERLQTRPQDDAG
jgi:signal transduction histidine kinase/CheY-like chemotaxis protein